MPWVKLDDGLWSHPKINGVSNDAVALFICGLSYAGQYTTDGMLSYANVERLAAFRRTGPSVTEELVEARLWERVELGFRIHDYLGYNKSREEIERDRAANVERQNRHRSYLNSVSHDVTNGVSNGVTVSPPAPAPAPYPEPGPGDSVDSAESTAAHSRAPAANYQDFHDRLRADKNAPAILAEAIGAAYGQTCREYGRLGKLARERGAGEVLKLVFALAPSWNGVDNPVDYLTAAANDRANGRRNGRATTAHPVHTSYAADLPETMDLEPLDNIAEELASEVASSKARRGIR